jgi:hypothetical protein
MRLSTSTDGALSSEVNQYGCAGGSVWETLKLWCSSDPPYLLCRSECFIQRWIREEIHQVRRDKQVNRITEKYTQKLEDLQACGRSQEMKIQELQDQNATQEAIIKELWEQLEKTSQEVPEQEPMMDAEEDPQELPQAMPAPPVFP